MALPLPYPIVPASPEFRAYLNDKKNNLEVPSQIVVESPEFRAFLVDANSGSAPVPAPGTNINSTEYRDFLSNL